MDESERKTAKKYVGAAFVHYHAKDFGKALRASEDGLALFPAHAGLCDIKMASLRALNGPEDAITFAEGLPRNLVVNWLVNRMASALIEANRVLDAEALLQEAPEEARKRQPYQMARIRVTEILKGPEAALREAQAFLESHPDRHCLTERVAGLLADLGRNREASECLEQLVTQEAPWSLRKQLATFYRRSGDLENTIRVLKEAESLIPKPPPGLFSDLATAFEEKGDIKEMLAVLERGLQRSPHDLFLCRLKIRSLRRLGRLDEALSYVRSLPSEIQVGKLSGLACSLMIETEQFDDALDFIEALSIDSQAQPEIQLARLQICHVRKGLSDAVDFLERSIKFPVRDLNLALEVSRIQNLAGRSCEAIATLVPFAKDAKPGPVHTRLASLYLQTGQPDKAIQQLDPIQEADSVGAYALLLLAQAHEESADPESALSVVEYAIRKFPDSPDLLERYWHLLSTVCGVQTGVDACNTALIRCTGLVEIQVAALRFMSRIGNDEGCEIAFKGIEQADPFFERGVLARAYHLLKRRDAIGAHQILSAARDNNGPSPPIDRLLAVACRNLGLLQDARHLIEPLLLDSGKNTEAVLELVNLRKSTGDYDGARLILDTLPVLTEKEEIRNLGILADIALDRAEVKVGLDLAKEVVSRSPDVVFHWERKVRADLMAGDVDSAWDSHRTWVDLRWRNDETGTLTRKVKRSLIGQIMNEFRLLGDDPALTLSRPGQDQTTAARAYKRSLLSNPTNTALALGLMTSLRRLGVVCDLLSEAQPTLSQSNRNRIPPTIVQFWDAPEPPHQVADLMDGVRYINPGYSYLRFCSDSAQDYLREKGETDAIKAFRLAPNAAGKADIFRLVFLWHEGGVYLDADDRCSAPLSTIIDHSLRFLGYQEPQMSVGNSFLAVQPHDPIIRAALDDAVHAFGGPQGEILWLSTGPGSVTRAVANHGTDGDGMPLPGVRLYSINILRNFVWPHVQLNYKSTPKSWIRSFLESGVERRNMANLAYKAGGAVFRSQGT